MYISIIAKIEGTVSTESVCKSVGIPVSVRENNHSVSNQTAGISIDFIYNQNISFEENLVSVHKKIQEKLRYSTTRYYVLAFLVNLHPSVMDSVLLSTYGCYENSLSEKMSDIMLYSDEKRRELGVTNLGRIDIHEDYGEFKVSDILFVPPKVTYSRRIFGISTFGDKLTICKHIMKNE